MVDLAMSIFEFLTKFLIFWHPWHPWVCVCSDLKQIWAIPPTVQDGNYLQPIGQYSQTTLLQITGRLQYDYS